MKKIPKPSQETPLERYCRIWFNSRGEDYDDGWKGAWRDLENGGCQSGMVSELVYYKDTLRFFKKHREEINRLLSETLSSCGYSHPSELFQGWDKDDPLAQDTQNQNLLAWFGFEETCRNIAHQNEVN